MTLTLQIIGGLILAIILFLLFLLGLIWTGEFDKKRYAYIASLLLTAAIMLIKYLP